MEYDKDKVDEVTLALLYLVMHDESEYGARAWKGFIGNPVSKAKSVIVIPEGCRRAKDLFEKHFAIQGDR